MRTCINLGIKASLERIQDTVRTSSPNQTILICALGDKFKKTMTMLDTMFAWSTNALIQKPQPGAARVLQD